MNTSDFKKKKRSGGRGPLIRKVLTVLLIAAIVIFIGKTAFDRFFPFEFEPSVSLDFQNADATLLDKLFKEDNCYPAFNGEVQCYMEENATIGPRGLVLRAEYVGNDPNGDPIITSGRVDTRTFFYKACGKYEVEASFPSGVGVFAAIWLREPDWLQSNKSLKNPAINVAEYQGGWADILHFNLHTDLSLSRTDVKSRSKSVKIGNLPDTFHTYGIEWTKSSIRYLVDGTVLYTIENNGDWIKGPTEMIFNLAMGGTWAESIADRRGLETWHGVQLTQPGQTWEMVVTNMRYYPLRDPDSCN